MRLTSGERNDGGRARGGWREEEKEEGWREGMEGGGGLLLHINGCRSNSQGLLEGKKKGGGRAREK